MRKTLPIVGTGMALVAAGALGWALNTGDEDTPEAPQSSAPQTKQAETIAQDWLSARFDGEAEKACRHHAPEVRPSCVKVASLGESFPLTQPVSVVEAVPLETAGDAAAKGEAVAVALTYQIEGNSTGYEVALVERAGKNWQITQTDAMTTSEARRSVGNHFAGWQEDTGE